VLQPKYHFILPWHQPCPSTQCCSLSSSSSTSPRLSLETSRSPALRLTHPFKLIPNLSAIPLWAVSDSQPLAHIIPPVLICDSSVTPQSSSKTRTHQKQTQPAVIRHGPSVSHRLRKLFKEHVRIRMLPSGSQAGPTTASRIFSLRSFIRTKTTGELLIGGNDASTDQRMLLTDPF
jgi:hypothetical protein